MSIRQIGHAVSYVHPALEATLIPGNGQQKVFFGYEVMEFLALTYTYQKPELLPEALKIRARYVLSHKSCSPAPYLSFFGIPTDKSAFEAVVTACTFAHDRIIEHRADLYPDGLASLVRKPEANDELVVYGELPYTSLLLAQILNDASHEDKKRPMENFHAQDYLPASVVAARASRSGYGAIPVAGLRTTTRLGRAAYSLVRYGIAEVVEEVVVGVPGRPPKVIALTEEGAFFAADAAI